MFFIHSMAGGGAERVTATLANHWSAGGWTVVVVTVTGVDSDFYPLDPRVERIGLNLDQVSTTRRAAFVSNWKRIRKLRRVLRERTPDVAISMMTMSNCILALAGLGLPVRTVGSERIHPPMFPLGRAWEWVRRRTYPLLDCVVAQTERTASWLRQQVPGAKVAVIPNPVSLPLDDREPRVDVELLRGTGRGRHILLAVGRLTEQKAFDSLLRAFADASSERDDWTLAILGEGRLREELTSSIADLGISGKVFLPGAVGNIGDWYEAADLYALTSRFEGFPNCLLEAMAHGLPVVAVDCDTGPAELVNHEVDGLLVPPHDQAGLVRSLRRFMDDAELRSRCAKRAADVRERYSLDSVAERWERTFFEGE